MKQLFPLLAGALILVEEGSSAQEVLNLYRQRVPEHHWGLFQTYFLGVLEWRSHLESILKTYSKLKLKKYPPQDRYIMLLALYGILFLRKPSYAIVSETVDVFKEKGSRLAPMANAILRSVLREENLEEKVYGKMTPLQKLVKKYGFPPGTTALFVEALGRDKAEELLLYSKSVPRTDILLLGQEEGSLAMLEEEGHVLRSLGIPRAYTFEKQVLPLEKMKAFREGRMYIQSKASQTLASLIPPGENFLDLCASPGGKSIALLARDRARKITAADLTQEKLNRIQENTQRLGLKIDLVKWDATKKNQKWIQGFDAVLLDAPCSGTGVLHRQKGESAKKDLADLEELTQQQSKMLHHAASYVRNQGFLIYSTCSILRQENEMRVEEFLKDHPEFILVNLDGGEGPFYHSYPHEGEDGFFACLMEKIQG